VKKNKKKKLKTHRGAAKRFKITSTGKIMRWHSGQAPFARYQEPRRMRKLANAVVVNPSNVRNIRLALPYGIDSCFKFAACAKAQEIFTVLGRA